MYMFLKGPDENQQMLIELPFLKMWNKFKFKYIIRNDRFIML